SFTAHPAPRVCNSFTEPRCGFACGADAARPLGFIHNPDLYPRCTAAPAGPPSGPPSQRLICYGRSVNFYSAPVSHQNASVVGCCFWLSVYCPLNLLTKRYV